MNISTYLRTFIFIFIATVHIHRIEGAIEGEKIKEEKGEALHVKFDIPDTEHVFHHKHEKRELVEIKDLHEFDKSNVSD